jgi:hypothetical protein
MAKPQQRGICRHGASHVVCFLAWFCTLQFGASARGKLPPTYPEKGTVTAVHVKETIDYAPIMPTDSKGRTHGGEAFVHRKHVYHIKTSDADFDLEGAKNPAFGVNDVVEFRIEKGAALVRVGSGEKKYRILSASSDPLK